MAMIYSSEGGDMNDMNQMLCLALYIFMLLALLCALVPGWDRWL